MPVEFACRLTKIQVYMAARSDVASTLSDKPSGNKLYVLLSENFVASDKRQRCRWPTSMIESRYSVCLALACAHGRRDGIATIYRLQIVVHEISEKYTAFRS